MPFKPPFCPYPECINHQGSEIHHTTWFVRNGHAHCRRTGITARFRCKRCHRYFSENTFHLDYRTHHRLDYRRIFSSMNSASGIRDMAREFKVSDKVILNRISRLARQSMAALSQLAREHQIDEDLAIDGFESFVHSQYWPNNFTIAVGSDSQFVYACDYAQMRRKGRMTARQKRRREMLNQRYPIAGKQLERSFTDVIDSLLHRWIRGPEHDQRTLHSDEKREYQWSLSSHPQWNAWKAQGMVRHQQTSSRVVRSCENPLFPVNYLDREFRKDQACHVRETVQWSKTVNNTMERMMVYLAYHNLFKPYRIKERSDLTHAEMAGIPRQRVRSIRRGMFIRRSFVHHLVLDISQWKTWHRIWKTPVFDLKVDVPEFAVA
jgi:transposase-like protein